MSTWAYGTSKRGNGSTECSESPPQTQNTSINNEGVGYRYPSRSRTSQELLPGRAPYFVDPPRMLTPESLNMATPPFPSRPEQFPSLPEQVSPSALRSFRPCLSSFPSFLSTFLTSSFGLTVSSLTRLRLRPLPSTLGRAKGEPSSVRLLSHTACRRRQNIRDSRPRQSSKILPPLHPTTTRKPTADRCSVIITAVDPSSQGHSTIRLVGRDLVIITAEAR